jgi:hypothetical protein|tara:strand:- start:444 stop:1019 length:576 start_codon:yes stop_codon:yes gene_type:complete
MVGTVIAKVKGSSAGDDYTMPASDGSSGEFLKTDGSGNLSFGSAAAGGKVLQVLFDGTSTNWSTSSTSYVDTDLSVSITPASASNKVLVTVSANYGRDNLTNAYGLFNLLRDSTSIAEGAFTDQYGPALGSLAVTVLDTPATTSALTYKVQGRVDDAASSMIVYLPRATGSMVSGDLYIGYASITVMEIAA